MIYERLEIQSKEICHLHRQHIKILYLTFKKTTAKVHLSAKVAKQKQYNHQEPQGFLT